MGHSNIRWQQYIQILRKLEDTVLEDEPSFSVWKSLESAKMQSATVDYVVSDDDG